MSSSKQDEQENRAKLDALRSADSAGEVGGVAEGDVIAEVRERIVSRASDPVSPLVDQSLADVVARITPENRYAEVSIGPEVGHEVIDDDMPEITDFSRFKRVPPGLTTREELECIKGVPRKPLKWVE